MDLKIWNESEEIPERPTLLRLKYDFESGGMDLIVVGADGRLVEGGVLLTVYQEGIARIEGMSSTIGFKLDEEERIKLLF